MGEELFETKKELMKHWEERMSAIEEIAALSNYGFAIVSADALDPKKHIYGWDAYMELLARLSGLLRSGMKPDDALDAVQTGWTKEKILEVWNEKADFSGIAG